MTKRRETGTRVTGAGLSVLGVGGSLSTAPTATERDIVQALMVFLEDRRVLFNPEYLEMQSDVDHSVLEIRAALTETLKQLDPKEPASAALRAMRAACRMYLDQPRQRFRFMHGDGRGHGDPGFFVALGALRALFGEHLQRLDDHFKLEIEPQLRSIFPAKDYPLTYKPPPGGA